MRAQSNLSYTLSEKRMTVLFILPIRDFSDVLDCTYVTQTVHLSLFIYQAYVCNAHQSNLSDTLSEDA